MDKLGYLITGCEGLETNLYRVGVAARRCRNHAALNMQEGYLNVIHMHAHAMLFNCKEAMELQGVHSHAKKPFTFKKAIHMQEKHTTAESHSHARKPFTCKKTIHMQENHATAESHSHARKPSPSICKKPFKCQNEKPFQCIIYKNQYKEKVSKTSLVRIRPG